MDIFREPCVWVPYFAIRDLPSVAAVSRGDKEQAALALDVPPYINWMFMDADLLARVILECEVACIQGKCVISSLV